MNTKKLFQMILLVAMLVSSLAFTTNEAFAASACGTGYTVIKGDTLRIIAAKCDTTIFALRRANPEIGSGDLIYPGQILLQPGALISGTNGLNIYIVARGDSVKLLASRFNITIDALVRMNPDITNINLIYEGQRLVVSGSGGIPNPPPSANGTYVVQSGDTLRKIAARFDTTVAAIQQVNPQIPNLNLIYVGQIINLPATASTYAVQMGDTLKIIAARFGTTLSNLLTLNPNITNPDRIYVGQVIRIR
jgi:peptidoglycan endopeptidase LytE